MRFVDRSYKQSVVEYIVFSFALSLPLVSIISSFLLPIAKNIQILGLCLLFFSFLLGIKSNFEKKNSEKNKKDMFHEIDIIKFLILLSTLLFFIISIIVCYPEMTYITELDITRNIKSILLVSVQSNIHQSFTYPWFHIYEASIYELSKPSIPLFQSALALLSIITILSFYIMVKAYLEDIDNHLPILATVFWSLFSGFGWIYLLLSKIEMQNINYYSLLSLANERSYGDIEYGQNVFLWFRPMTIGFMLLFCLLYILRKEIGSKLISKIISIFILIALFFYHIPEYIFFITILIIIAIFIHTNELNIKIMLTSSIISFICIFMIYTFLLLKSIKTVFPLGIFIGLFIGTILAYFIRMKSWNNIKFKNNRKIEEIIFLIFASLFISGLIFSLSSESGFYRSMVQ